MKRILLFASFVLLTSRGFSQDDPPVPTPPAPVVVADLEIVGPTEFKFGEWIELEAKGGPIGPILWRYKDATGPTPKWRYLKTAEGKDDLRKIELAYFPGAWTLEVLAADTTTIQTDLHTFTIEGGGPTPTPPNPPVVKTLRDKAGTQIVEVEKFHVEMLASIGKSLFDTPDRFKEVYAEVAKGRGLSDNLAVTECTKRLNLSTLEAIKAELEKIVSELTTAPVGKIKLIVVHETADADAAIGRLIVNIRDGDIKKYLTEKGYGFTLILDDDDPDSAIVRQLKPTIDQIGLPAVFVLDVSKDPHPILHSQKLTEAEMSTAGFLAAIKKGGA